MSPGSSSKVLMPSPKAVENLNPLMNVIKENSFSDSQSVVPSPKCDLISPKKRTKRSPSKFKRSKKELPIKNHELEV